MAIYKILVTQTLVQSVEVEVEARDGDEALDIAETEVNKGRVIDWSDGEREGDLDFDILSVEGEVEGEDA